DASTAFYRTLLGIPLHEATHDDDLKDPWYGGLHAACSWTDGGFLHFAIYPSKGPHLPVTTAAQFGFHVAEFDEVHQRVSESGVNVLQEPRDEPWGKTARYLDPDGNIVSITAI
ncbi:MAG: VOC family protein, partial [Gammaproteobacteria bacterium]|nr:VOC family protein [Gammaproteobacteria bacterium]